MDKTNSYKYKLVFV